MSAGITMVQGDDMRIFVTVRDTDGDPVDVSNASSIRYKIAPRFGTTAVVEKSLGSGISVVESDEFSFDITSADSGSLTPGSYKHEAQVITSTGLIYTVFRDSVRILPQIITEES